jgi:hypothetical protein
MLAHGSFFSQSSSLEDAQIVFVNNYFISWIGLWHFNSVCDINCWKCDTIEWHWDCVIITGARPAGGSYFTAYFQHPCNRRWSEWRRGERRWGIRYPVHEGCALFEGSSSCNITSSKSGPWPTYVIVSCWAYLTYKTTYCDHPWSTFEGTYRIWLVYGETWICYNVLSVFCQDRSCCSTSATNSITKAWDCTGHYTGKSGWECARVHDRVESTSKSSAEADKQHCRLWRTE